MKSGHSAEEICRNTWHINEFNLVNAFLIQGGRNAVLIDTGCGLSDLRGTVSSLTERDLSVFLTHSHPDHLGGIYEFRDCPIYMSSLESGERIFNMGLDNAFRRMYVETRGPVNNPGHQDEMLSAIPEEEPDCSFNYIDIPDGFSFDLGGRSLTAILTPGHTSGSMCFLDEKERILFSGDTVNRSIIIQRQKDNSSFKIEEYYRTLEKLWHMQSRFDFLLIGHGNPVLEKEIISDYLKLTEGLLSGTIIGSYEEKGFRKGEVARLGKAELWYRCDQ